ncbi:MAG: right-handed parallel beta-helix repeat-containing protein [Puniceicoccaceae bacterium]
MRTQEFIFSYRSRTILGLLSAALAWQQTALADPSHIIEVDGGVHWEQWTEANPYVLREALRKAREIRRTSEENLSGEIQIVLGDGFYPLVDSVLIRPEDSGTLDSPTVIMAAPGTRPVISGGIALAGWRLAENLPAGFPATALGKVWVVEAPMSAGRPVEYRHMWLNGNRVAKARDNFGEEMQRILEWDKPGQVCWIPAEAVVDIKEIGRMEMVIHQMWAIAILRVKSLEVVEDRARLTFHEPEGRIQFEHPWPPVVISEEGNSAYYLTNHPAFLNQPGEWYQDLTSGKIYYWPQEGESMPEAQAIVPSMETLLNVAGTVDRPVEHVRFEGVTFSHTNWLRPSRAGHVPLQAGMYLLDAYKLRPAGTPDKAGLENQAWIGRQPAAVQVEGARDLLFEDCRFTQLGASGLDLIEGVRDSTIRGSLFRDIGSNGLVMGTFQEGGIETHLPFDPADARILCQAINVSDNLFTDIANEDWGCVGIVTGFVRDVTIAHNEICDVSYTGISLGWGWTKSVNVMQDNRIHANHIHHFGKRMYDTGGIYTLSPQPSSVISENFIHSIYRPSYVHDPNHWSYIYLDEGSSYFTVRDNWTEGLKYSTNANGPGNTWTNNGPSVSARILQRAGIREEFAGLINFRTVQPDDPVVP